jgi:hypothetical protein
MVGSTLAIANNVIIITHDKTEDCYVDSDCQKLVILASYLGGYSINYTTKSITLFLTLKGMYSYTIEFNRGGIPTHIVDDNFGKAIVSLCGAV